MKGQSQYSVRHELSVSELEPHMDLNSLNQLLNAIPFSVEGPPKHMNLMSA